MGSRRCAYGGVGYVKFIHPPRLRRTKDLSQTPHNMIKLILKMLGVRKKTPSLLAYRESWQPHPMSAKTVAAAEHMAGAITEALGGRGLFGVEMFIKGEDVIFSEVSPRPHDTGLVTLISQDLSEFALHVRAILGLPIPNIHQHGPSASCAVLVEGESNKVQFGNLSEVLSQLDTQMRLFGKPNVSGQRRMAVTLARGADIQEARSKAHKAASAVEIAL